MLFRSIRRSLARRSDAVRDIRRHAELHGIDWPQRKRTSLQLEREHHFVQPRSIWFQGITPHIFNSARARESHGIDGLLLLGWRRYTQENNLCKGFWYQTPDWPLYLSQKDIMESQHHVHLQLPIWCVCARWIKQLPARVRWQAKFCPRTRHPNSSDHGHHGPGAKAAERALSTTLLVQHRIFEGALSQLVFWPCLLTWRQNRHWKNETNS